MVNLELYKVFYTVAKCKSITKAAEELFISQPAVSQAIKSLEAQLGGALFNRVSRGMELTETGGKQMFAVVENVMELLSEAEKKFTEMKNVATGSVRIAASDNVINFFLLRYIKEFKETYPDVSLYFINGTTKECIDAVHDDKADIGFVNLPVTVNTVTFTGQTGKIHDVFVASDNFRELFYRPVQLSALCNYPLLMLDPTTMTRTKIDEFAHTLNIKFTPDLELGSVELLTAMAVEGMGIACVPREYVLKELASGQLTEIKTVPELPTRAVGVITNKQQSASFAVNEFLKLLNKYETTD